MGIEYKDLYLVLVPIISIVLNKIVIDVWRETKAKRERRDLWIDTLRIDQTIDGCLNEFDNLTTAHGKGTTLASFIAVAAGSLLSIWLIKAPSINAVSTFSAILTFNLYLLLPTMLLGLYIDILIERNFNLIRNSNYVAIAYYGLNQFATVGILFIIILGITSLVNNTQEILDNYVSLIGSFLISCFAFFLYHRISKNVFGQFGNSLGKELNNKYLADYPKLLIKTKENELEGVIQDIFNEELVLLKDRDQTEIVEWESISILRIHDKNWIDTNLSDFWNLEPSNSDS